MSQSKFDKLELIIKDWKESNCKLYKIEDIYTLREFINLYYKKYDIDIKDKITSIKFSNDYTFEYLNIPKLELNNIVRYENIFKLNLQIIIENIREYFLKKLNIKLELVFESPSKIDLELKKESHCFKHDCYIKIYNDKEYYDIGIEYYEKKSHNKYIDDVRERSSSIILDKYIYYDEKLENFQNKSYNQIMKEIVYNIILLICCITDDKFTLSKILFFEDYKGNQKSLKTDTDILNYILDCHKNDRFNINNFFTKVNPTNLQGEKYSIEEFIEFIEDTFENSEIELENYEYYGNYKLLENLILHLHEDQSKSRNIGVYKNIYKKAFEIMINAADKINKINKDKNENYKKYLADYIKDVVKFHLPSLHPKYIDHNVFIDEDAIHTFNSPENEKKRLLRIQK
jgi:hypothetical protein